MNFGSCRIPVTIGRKGLLIRAQTYLHGVAGPLGLHMMAFDKARN